jgi:biopolymer transport protein ExbD
MPAFPPSPIPVASDELPPRRRSKSRPPDTVDFPVAPMLDMAFQLLAFFILTFQAPSRETRVDLYLPSAPIALPGSIAEAGRPAPPVETDSDLETDLVVRAQASELGDLASLTLLGSSVPDATALKERLTRYVAVMSEQPVRIRLLADESLRYEEAAKLIAACSSAGVQSIRLGGPDELPGMRVEP